ncbi:MAG: PEP-CTERM sorting domain-containing protein [Microcystaceae cyanobacterium]
MFKKLALGAVCTSALAFGLTAESAQAQVGRHSFFFEAPTIFEDIGDGVINEFDFSGHLAFDNDGTDATLSLDLMSTEAEDFEFDFGSVDLIFTAGTGFSLFGDPANGDPATTLLTFDAFLPAGTFPDTVEELSAYLAGDVTGTATIGPDIAEDLPTFVVDVVDDVSFTKKVPEPSATLAFLTLGLVGAGLKLSRKA